MPKKTICIGFKVAFRVDAHKGFILATNNPLMPLGVLPEIDPKLQFENAVFQILCGDGDVTSDLPHRKTGEELKFGHIVRLLHVTSNTLVCENKRSRAMREKANQKIGIEPMNSEEAKGSKWRVMPRYKVRGEGEKVIDGDHIILQSISGDQYIHHAASTDDSVECFYEINGSHTPSGIVIRAYDTEQRKNIVEQRELRGGDCIALFHREEKAFMTGAADGCLFHPDSSTQKEGADSALARASNNMFVIEFASAYEGGIVTIGRRRHYRLKHLATGLYLGVKYRPEGIQPAKIHRASVHASLELNSPEAAGSAADMNPELMGSAQAQLQSPGDDVVDDTVIGLMEGGRETDVYTQVCFHAATDDPSNEVKNRSRVFVEFPLAGHGYGSADVAHPEDDALEEEAVWLTTGWPLKNTLRTTSSMTAEMDITRPRKEAVVMYSANHKDGIELFKVPTEEFQALNRVLALIPPLKRYAEKMKAGHTPDQQFIALARENVSKLGRMCTQSNEEDILIREGNPIAEAQNRLADQQLVEILKDMLHATFNVVSPGTTWNAKSPVDMDSPNLSSFMPVDAGKDLGADEDHSTAAKFIDFLNLTKVVVRAFKLMAKGNFVVGELIASHIKMLIAFVQRPIFGALDMFYEVYKDNTRLFSNHDDVKDLAAEMCGLVHKFVREQQNPDAIVRLLKFLPMLCICGEKGIRSVQDLVIEKLTVSVETEIFPRLSFASDIVTIESIRVRPPAARGGPGSPQMSLRMQKNKDMDRNSSFVEEKLTIDAFKVESNDGASAAGGRRGTLMSSTSESQFGGGENATDDFIATVRLLGALARGRNQRGVDLALKCIPAVAQIPVCANVDLPPALRTVFIQLARTTIVDVDPHGDLHMNVRNIVQLWDHAGEPPKLNDDDVKPIVTDLKQFALKYLAENKSMCPSEQEKNRCVLSTVELCGALIRFGMFAPSEYMSVVRALAPVLDGRDDIDPPPQVGVYGQRIEVKFSRYTYTHDHSAIIECKMAVLADIQILIDFVLATAVTQLVQCFKKGEPLPHYCAFLDFDPKTTIHADSKKMIEDKIAFAKKQENMLLGGLGALTDGLGAGLGALKGLGKGALSIIPGVNFDDQEKPFAVLLHLMDTLIDCMQYDFLALVIDSTKVLLKLVNFHLSIIPSLKEVQLLHTKESVRFYKEATIVSEELRQFAEAGLTAGQGRKVEALVKSMLEQIRRAENAADVQPIESQNQSREEYGAMLSAIVSQNDVDATVLSERRSMVHNLNVHDYVASILAAVPAKQASKGSIERMLLASYTLLREIVSGTENLDIAIDVFAKAEGFLGHLDLDVGVTELYTDLLDGNMELCHTVTDKFLQDIVFAIAKAKQNGPLVHVLRLAVLQYEGNSPIWITRNHASVIKMLLEVEEAMPGTLRCEGEGRFTGKKGAKNVSTLFNNEMAITSPLGPIAHHLEMLLVMLASVYGKDPKKKIEGRFALFQREGLKDVIRVCKNEMYPPFYRDVYVHVLHRMFLDDKTVRGQLFENKYFCDMIKVFAVDLSKCAWIFKNSQLPDDFRNYSGGRVCPNSPLYSAELFMHFIFVTLLPCIQHFIANTLTREFGTPNDPESQGLGEEKRDEIGLELNGLADALYDLHSSFSQAAMPPPLPGQVQSSGDGSASHRGRGHLRSASDIYFPNGTDEPQTPKESVFLSPSCISAEEAAIIPRCITMLYDLDLQIGGMQFEDSIQKVAMAFHDAQEMAEEEARRKAEEEERQRIEAEKKKNRFFKVPSLPFKLPFGRGGDGDDANKLPDMKDGDLSKLFARWKEFRRRYSEIPELDDEWSFRSGAIFLLRCGVNGDKAIKALVRICDDPEQPDEFRMHVMTLLRQVISSEDDPFDDASVMRPDPLPLMIDGKPIDDDVKERELDETIVTINKEKRVRQTLLAQNTLLAPKVVQMFGTPSRAVVMQVLALGCTLLSDGNTAVQASIVNWAKDRSDEQFFNQSRAKLLQCRDQLREKRKLIKKERPLKGQRNAKLSEETLARVRRKFDFVVFEELLKLLQLSCEGHYTDMQNYLREQLDNQVSINVLEPVVAVLEGAAKTLDRVTLSLTLQALATLAETIQGPCVGNQEMLISQNIGDVITTVISNKYADCSDDENWEIRTNAMILLASLLEANMDYALVSILLSSLDLRVMVTIMEESYIKFCDENGIKRSTGNFLMEGLGAGKDLVAGLVKGLLVGEKADDETTDSLALGCTIFMFMKACLDLQTLVGGVQYGRDPLYDRDGLSVKEAFRMASKNGSFGLINRKIGSIEIQRHGKLERTYFRIPAMSSNLPKTSKETVIKEVDRSGDNARVADFFERSLGLIREMEYYEQMRQTPGLSIIHKYSVWFDTFSLIVGYILNLMLLIDVNYTNFDDNDEGLGKSREGYVGLGIFQMVLQCLLFVHFFFGPTRIHLNDAWMRWQERKNEKAVRESKQNMSIEPPKIDNNAEDKLPKPVHLVMCVAMVLTWAPFYLRALFLVTAFLGYFIHPIFYCVQLLQVIQKSAQLQNVVLSVTKNGRNLVLTFLLLLVVVYIFAVIAFYNYSQYFQMDVTDGWSCDTLGKCFLIMLVYGLRNGGGMGDVMLSPQWGKSDGNEALLRLLFDFLYFLALIIIFLNIVFGIILDTFAELREQREFVESNQHDQCFICGIPMAEFERSNGSSFEQHFEYEHNMWDYLFFMHYVQQKPQGMQNGPEDYVFKLMDAHDISFFPVQRALATTIQSEAEDSLMLHQRGEKKAEAAGEGAGATSQAVLDMLEGIVAQLDALRK